MAELETWCYCASCARWYYSPRDAQEDMLCPVCGSEPTAVEERQVN